MVLVVAALIIDGTLTYELFDFRRGDPSGLGYLLLALILMAVIFLADHSKKNGNKNTPE